MAEVTQPKRLRGSEEAVGCMVTTRSTRLRSVVNAVPDELWINVLGYLSPVDISVVGGTSTRLNGLSKDPSLWKKLNFDIANLGANLWAVELVVDRAVKAEEMRFTNKRDKEVDDMAVASLIVRAKETLKILSVSPRIKLKNEAVAKFGCLTKLEVLNLGFKNISSTGLKAIATLKGLRELKIPTCLTVERDSDLGYLFRELKNLEVVDMPFITITSATFSLLIENNSNLEVLSFHCAADVSLANLAKKCPNLKSLDLACWGGFHDDSINDLVHAKNLQKLKLGCCPQLTNSTLKNISRNCNQLKYLDLRYCKGVRDEAIAVLAQNCHNLQFLDLTGCHTLTKEVIVELAGACQELTKLILSQKFSGTFKKKLRKDYPNLMVI